MKRMHWVVAGLLLASAAPLCARAPQAAAPKNPPAKSKAPAKKAASREPYDKALLTPASLNAKAPETFDVKFTTTKGEFTVRVTRAWAPLGADRFYNLVRHHFFDAASFFRVHDGFVVQFGLSAYPAVSAAWSKAVIKDDPVTQSNKNGFITFATGGPNTRTTQLFINLGNNARLDGMGFSPFGQVVDGMTVVVRLYGGYGESPDMGGTGPQQDKIESQGKPYLDKGWPKLDSIQTAVIVATAGDAGAAKPPAAKK
jgi:peptidyl-prolyl cis-trans isomerase A (cyclophilin A)